MFITAAHIKFWNENHQRPQKKQLKKINTCVSKKNYIFHPSIKIPFHRNALIKLWGICHVIVIYIIIYILHPLHSYSSLYGSLQYYILYICVYIEFMALDPIQIGHIYI